MALTVVLQNNETYKLISYSNTYSDIVPCQ